MKANMTTFKLLAALLFAATLSVSNVHASTITVMNNNDSGPNSLRDAIATASAGDMIQFAAAVTGVITLTSSELLINKSITISGPGANILAVDGNHARRVFHITSGNTVTISGLSITNGNAGNSFGGGIFNDISGGSATLTLSNCTVSGNRAASIGGGICNVAVHGSATLGQSLADAGLVDRYHLLVFPLLLGAGKRLFSEADKDATRLKLVDHAAYSNGIQKQVFDVVR